MQPPEDRAINSEEVGPEIVMKRNQGLPYGKDGI